MVARFDAVRFMGVGRIFSKEWEKKWIFSSVVKNIYPREGQSGENSFYPLKTTKTTFC